MSVLKDVEETNADVAKPPKRSRTTRIINIAIVLTSLIGYLKWGPNSMFLFQMEADILAKMFVNPLDTIDPFTVLPMLGQILLVITFFQKKPSKNLTIAGVLCIGLLLGFIFVIGLISLSAEITIASLPFVGLATWQLRRRHRL